jgi:hypothetical protein
LPGNSSRLLTEAERYTTRDVSAMEPFGGALSCVKDARRRYRNPSFNSDLAAVLATFTYSKETREQDRIYSTLGLVKSPANLNQILTPDYRKTAAQVFYEAAVYILNERKDLFFWGIKSLRSNRRMAKLPSWVPECIARRDSFYRTGPKLIRRSLMISAYL